MDGERKESGEAAHKSGPIKGEVHLEVRPGDKSVSSVELSQFDLFRRMKKPVSVGKVTGSVVLRSYRKGEIICQQGQTGGTAFYIPTALDLARLVALKEKKEAPDERAIDSDRDRHILTAVIISSTTRVRPKGFFERMFSSGSKKTVARTTSIRSDGPTDIDFETREAPLMEGDLFGEMSCISFSPRSATVIARVDCQLLEFNRNVFDQLREDPNHQAAVDAEYRRRTLETHLRQFQFFRDLSEAQIQTLKKNVELEVVPPGKIICAEGEQGTSEKPLDVFIVRNGVVQVTMNHRLSIHVEDILNWPALCDAIENTQPDPKPTPSTTSASTARVDQKASGGDAPAKPLSPLERMRAQKADAAKAQGSTGSGEVTAAQTEAPSAPKQLSPLEQMRAKQAAAKEAGQTPSPPPAAESEIIKDEATGTGEPPKKLSPLEQIRAKQAAAKAHDTSVPTSKPVDSDQKAEKPSEEPLPPKKLSPIELMRAKNAAAAKSSEDSPKSLPATAGEKLPAQVLRAADKMGSREGSPQKSGEEATAAATSKLPLLKKPMPDQLGSPSFLVKSWLNDHVRQAVQQIAKKELQGEAVQAAQGLVLSALNELLGNPTIPKDEPGHPITHRFVTGVPTSQCIVCHIHPGTTVMNSYLGYMWWDQETDGEFMYPKVERKPTSEEFTQSQMNDPNEITARGNWSDPDFLQSISQLNPLLKKSHFADFNGHGWVFKAVFKKDREGNYLDHFGNQISAPDADQRQAAIDMSLQSRERYRNRDDHTAAELKQIDEAFRQNQKGVPVHLLDIHLEKGMHCVDCHFVQDVHGNTKLYGEVRAAIEIRCEDCHGSVERRAVQVVNGIPKMFTSGPAAEEHPSRNATGRDLTSMRTPFGKRRFEIRNSRIIQNSMVEKDVSWEIKQVVDTINPKHPDYNALSALAKTVRFSPEGETEWGDVPVIQDKCAHHSTKMSCVACHSSWNPSCYGCHLPQKANKKLPNLHNEGDVTRNYVSYNFQTLREDIYMLAHDGNVTGNRLGPARSSCAVHVTSYNGNRESIYTQQQTISGEGMSGIAFSTNVPHTVRARGETKTCADCHITPDNSNNAQMAQLLMQGTNFMNFIGRYCWVGAGAHGIHGVTVTERDEPQTVFGSSMHQIVYPDRYRKHCEADSVLWAARHPGKDIGDNVLHPLKKPEILSLLARGEFLYAACGAGGVRVFDIAFIDNKGFSQRFSTAPVSPLGQKFYVRTKYATSVAAPTTIAPDPTRTHRPENYEAAVHALYGYIYATDLYEGLILIASGTLLDGNPTNNFLEPSVVYNPDGCLNGARAVSIVGRYAYVSCDAGLVVVDLNDPKQPCIVSTIGSELLSSPTAVQVQFRYGFVCDKEGLKVLDVTDLAHPRLVTCVPMRDARNVYVARNYAYVAAGCEGLVILDVKNPEAPLHYMTFNAGGEMDDVNDVKLGAYYASQFAFVADGRHGMRVLQLTSPDTHGYDSFLPKPFPRLVACYPMPHGGCALAISEGVDRDRAVDESGNQIAVFGRVGARPMSFDEQRRLYLSPDGLTPFRIPDIRRDEEIAEPRKREIDLHFRVESRFGPSRHTSMIRKERAEK